jgi:uncharacterized protein
MAKSGVLVRISLVRLLTFFVVLFVVYAAGQGIGLAIEKHLPPHLHDLTAAALLFSDVALVAWVYGLLVRWLEKRMAAELWPVRPGLLLLGVAGAVVTFTAIYAVLWIRGVAVWGGYGGTAGLAMAAIIAVYSGIGEELVFRGGAYRILEESFGSGAALILSGALFGALHLQNPHATWFTGVAVALEAGLLLGAAYAAARSLWLPIGMHIGWNFSEGGVFGAAVSGRFGGHGLIDMPLKGPDILTGGAFGPENSVVTVVLCLLWVVLFVLIAMHRGTWVPMRFKMVQGQ